MAGDFDQLMMERLRSLIGDEFVRTVLEQIPNNPDPVQATINLERWLASTSNPHIYAEQFNRRPDQLAMLLTLIGASQPLADVLIQNPEFGSLFLDARETEQRSEKEELVKEGRKLLQSATSPSHALDRIRYLKQRHNLIICLNDLGGGWSQEDVWRALSDLADAVILLTLESSWKQFANGKDLPDQPPVGIIGFGKLGARELNYSSDVDLAYVLLDGSDEHLDRECAKFCGAFGRALSDRMGRGALYRIDLRLRPYGGSGPIISTLGSFANYYKLYAEPWEIQALIKSRVVAGESFATQWEEIKSDRAFATSLSDSSLAEVLGQRRLIEDFSGEEDLKRGAGGIRDVEFLCQTLQLVYGQTHPNIRLAGTCEAIRALAEDHLIEENIAGILIESYTFLRKLEHRIQLLGDRQTHSFPSDPIIQKKLALVMDLDDASSLRNRLDLHRKSIRSLYRSLLRQEEEHMPARTIAGEATYPHASTFFQWFDALPEPDAYYRSLNENEGSLARVRTILNFAPRLVPRFKTNLSLTEMLISGEIEERQAVSERWALLPLDAPEKGVADLYANELLIAQAQWALSPEIDLEQFSMGVADELMRYCSRRFEGSFDIIALGSYGSAQMGINSDIDILLLTRFDHQTAERSAQQMLNFLLQLKRYGLEAKVDLRLRPDGQKGLLVRSYDGFGAYEVGDMEMWERFALGHARLVSGSPEAMDLVRHAAYAVALNDRRLAELTAMKTRIETERLKPQYLTRDIKLGNGGLNDLEWIIHLYEMKDPQRVDAGSDANIRNRIRNLGRSGVLNAFEVEALSSALDHLLNVRKWIALLQFPADLVPENPDKLDRLAAACGEMDGNEFLRMHQPIIGWVRGFFHETLSRISS